MLQGPPILRIAGAPLDRAIARCVAGIVLRQRLGSPALVEITCADPPPDRMASLSIGQPVALAVGTAPLFSGEITAVEHDFEGAGGRVLRIRAYDRLHRLRKRQQSRAFAERSLSDLVTELAANIGARAGSVPYGPLRPLIIQHDQSDFVLLAQLAAASGLYPRLSGDVVDLVALDGDAAPPVRLRRGAEVLSAQVALNSDTLRQSTRVFAWDPATLTVHEGGAATARQDAVELRDCGSSAFAGVGQGSGARILVNRLAAGPEEAAASAQAEMDRAVGRQFRLSAEVAGDPALRPGSRVALEGFGPDIDGEAVLTTVVHRFDHVGGYLVTLSTDPPEAPEPPRIPAATLGRVTDVVDPERRCRARVTLPGYGGVETGWMPVMVMGAGGGKGAVVLPEPGDEVLVLFPDGDPARGLVLGGFHGSGDAQESLGPEGLGRDGSARGYVLRTPSGQRLVLDGSGALARIETSSGDLFEFASKGARLFSTRDLVIEAPGQRILLRAAAIDFERG